MIAIDTSAIASILFEEDDRAIFARIISQEAECLLSSVSYLEISMVLEGKNPHSNLLRRMDELVLLTEIEIVPFDYQQSLIARRAFIDYGKGRHKAKLNFGDCASYALAKVYDVPLLFKGKDFIHTDIKSVFTSS